MEQDKPDMLILADKYYVRGLDKGYYPDVQEELIRRGSELGILSVEQAEERWGKNILSSRPHTNGLFYILNKYDGRYYPVDDTNLTSTLAQQKAMAYKEALLMLGAKSVRLNRKAEEVSSSSVSRSTSGSIGYGWAGVKGNKNEEYRQRARQCVETALSVEHPNNKAESVDKVKAYLQQKGLGNDYYLSILVEQLESNRLEGRKETLTMTYLSELDKGHRTTSSLSAGFKLFKATLSSEWQRSSHTSYELSEQLEVTF